MMSNQFDDDLRRIHTSLERTLQNTDFYSAYKDREVIEIMLNPDGSLWVDKLGAGMSKIGTMSATVAENVIRSVSGCFRKEVHSSSPILECKFPLDGSRFAAQLPPIVNAPTFALRKRAVKIFTLEQYLEQGALSKNQYSKIIQAIKDHRNILIAGGTGSGKTTLLNAVINSMVVLSPNERMVIMEDTPEIQCAAENAVLYETSPEVDLSALVKVTLRMRPDRILIGEIRGGEALSLLESWNTGHPGGVATVHCNSAEDATHRVVTLVSKNKEAPRNIENMVGQILDIIIFIEKDKSSGKRCVKELVEVVGYENNKFIFNSI
ncbi:P-type conjugative transfer ATPase TrbB [Pasteurella multocida]|uniref:P-type conjugative transfer ATPase TrbB n=1 Tax=Pasteurella multocida TaxID=747 RepID=UPI001F6226FB|nr:P-type conjugative transfer ATPase TrbB [Pasteurella multocida]